MSDFTSFYAFGMPGPTEIWVILLIVLLLFGTRIPTMMRSLGQGVNEFKRGLKDSNGEPAIDAAESNLDESKINRAKAASGK